MTKRRAEGNKQSLVVVLKTYQLMAQAIQEQLKRRSDLHKAIDKAGEQLKEVQLQSTKLQGKAGKEKKVAELDAQASELKIKIGRQREEYAQFTATLLWELECFHRTKNAELHHALHEYAQAHEDFGLKSYDQWRNLALKLGGTGATMTRTLSRHPSTGVEGASPGMPSSAGGHGFQSLSIHAVHGEAGSAAGDGADGAAGSSTSEPTTPRSATGREETPPNEYKAPQRKFSFDDEDSRGAAFSSDIDPATLGPPPEWGTTTPFMPPLAAAPPEPTPPEDAATEPEPEPAPVAEAKADGAKAGGAKDELD